MCARVLAKDGGDGCVTRGCAGDVSTGGREDPRSSPHHPEMEMVTKGTPGESVGVGTQSQERWEW